MVFKVVTIISVSEYFYVRGANDYTIMTPDYIKFEIWVQLEFVMFLANVVGYICWLAIRSVTKNVEIVF